MSPTPYSPAILVIDDDATFTSYIRASIHNRTSLGVLVANNLRQAKELIDSPDIKIDAVIADIFFDNRTNDPENSLLDGIDVLRYTGKHRPAAQKYVLSIWCERERERLRAEGEGLSVTSWFHKMFYNPSLPNETPWSIVERDLIKQRLASDPETRRRVAEVCGDQPLQMDDISECVQLLRFPLRTYIQSLPGEDFVLSAPIEVVCFKDEDSAIRAHALRIGMLAEGGGSTVDDAVEELAQFILDQAEEFESERDESFQGYARLVRTTFANYVKRRPTQ